MRLLLINDDGFYAEGLAALVAVLKDEHELYVCAPKEHMSGMGHAITVVKDIPVEKVELEGVVQAYIVDGTPSDCAKIACLYLFKEIEFDLVLSGINDGANMGADIIYSGTVSAAHEAYRYANHAIALSVANKDRSVPNNYKHAASHIAEYIKQLDYSGAHFLYNINYPYMRAPRALKYAYPSDVDYREKIVVHGDKQSFRIHFTGTPVNVSKLKGNDFELLEHGYATLVPVLLAVRDEALDNNTKPLYNEREV